MSITRRDFIKVCGAGTALLGMGAKFPSNTLTPVKRSVPTGGHATNGVLIDTTQCVGCRSCQRACCQVNGLPYDSTATTLSAESLTIVGMHNVSPDPAKPVIQPVKFQCMHCEEPACVSVCPVGAIYKTNTGTVAYDADKCLGCRYCMTACPFGVPKYDWAAPDPKIIKCQRSCLNGTTATTPACVQACPNNALTFGKREDLLAIAKTRIRQNPDKYVDHIYGEKEIGGTSMLYIASQPFDRLGFRTDLPTTPLPQYTLNVMEKVPYVLGLVFATLSGIAWWTRRGERAATPVPATSPVPIDEG